jgi:hypothetical protein
VYATHVPLESPFAHSLGFTRDFHAKRAVGDDLTSMKTAFLAAFTQLESFDLNFESIGKALGIFLFVYWVFFFFFFFLEINSV